MSGCLDGECAYGMCGGLQDWNGPCGGCCGCLSGCLVEYEDSLCDDWPRQLGDGHIYEEYDAEGYCVACGWPWFKHEELAQ